MRKFCNIALVCILVVSISGCAVGMALSGKREPRMEDLREGMDINDAHFIMRDYTPAVSTTSTGERVEEYKKSSTAFPALSVVFVPAIFTLLLVVSTFITVTRLQEERESRIKAAETIERIQVVSISPTTVSITFQTKTAVKSNIAYGRSTLELISKSLNTIPAFNHDILLTDLKPNTIYIYKITLGDEMGRKFTTEEQVFVTGRE